MKKCFILLQVLILVTVSIYAQNVGVGTTTPSEKLHVAGNIKGDTIKPNVLKLSANAGQGKILTSDAVGNANWQINSASAAGNLGFGVWGDCATNGNLSAYNPVADAAGVNFDFFGYSVSISGNFAIVGSYQDDIGSNINQGSASIYQHNGTDWVFLQKLTDPTGASEDYFGTSVAISGNYAIVGAPNDNNGTIIDIGSASIFHYDGSAWVFVQQFTDPTISQDYFGFSVDISEDFAFVGAYRDAETFFDQGSVFVFRNNGGNWAFQQKLLDPSPGSDFFGASLSLSGNHLIVGADDDDVGSNISQGSASIFQFNGTSWVHMQKLTDATGGQGDHFGNSVSISGNIAVVGSRLDDVTYEDQGSVSIYQYNGTSWVLMEKITHASGGPSDYFGSSVSISGNYLMIGAFGDDVGSNFDQGSAVIYVRVGLGWQKIQDIIDPAGKSTDRFGWGSQLDASTKRMIISSPWYTNSSGKVVFGKLN